MCLQCAEVFLFPSQAEEKLGGKKGRLLGIITLSDVLRYMVGATNIGGDGELSEEDDA